MIHSSLLIRNVNLATMVDDSLGIVNRGALVTKDGAIAWLGLESDLPRNVKVDEEVDGGGRWLTPGLVDCHTHLVYGGNRSNEFAMRLNGATYSEIAAAGGGIRATVASTRAATEGELFESGKRRLTQMLNDGLTTVEIKSGYGLDIENEAKMLRVAKRLGEALDVHTTSTYLGAHAVPSEFQGRSDAYIDAICSEHLPSLVAQGLVDSVDGFCENIAFSASQMERVFEAAKQFGLPVKLHACQHSDQGSAELVAKFHGLSADHLEYLSANGIEAMKQAGTVAVLLPGAFYFLREKQAPPIQSLRNAGVPMALATDCNPGTSPMTSLRLAMNFGCVLFGLTPEETLSAVTRNAARALGREASIGTLEIGKHADLALWNIDHPNELSYHLGLNLLERRFVSHRNLV